MNVIIAHHKNNSQEDITSLRRFFQLVYQGNISFGTPTSTPINVIWLENIWWGWLFSGIFFLMILTDFFNSLIAGGLFSYFVMSSYYSLLGFMGIHYLVKFLMYLTGWWVWGLFIFASILGGYLYAVALAILEGDFSRDRKYKHNQTEFVCFELYSHCNHDSYMVTDCISTFLLKWKTSYDYHIKFVVKELYRMTRKLVYNNDSLLTKS